MTTTTRKWIGFVGLLAFAATAGVASGVLSADNGYGVGDGTGPIAVVVSRLTEQKGVDLLFDALPAFLERGGRIALLGLVGLLLIDVLTTLLVLLAQAPVTQAFYEAAVRQLPADAMRLAVFVAVVWVADRFGVASVEARQAAAGAGAASVGEGSR